MKLSKKAKCLTVCAILALLVALAYSPPRPELPYRVMPESATILSDHHDLRGRWRDVVVIPAVSNALAIAGVDAAEFRDEPGWRILIPLTTGENTVLSFTPSYGTDGNPVLWGASFGGWRAPVLKFLLLTRWIPGLGRLDVAPNGSKYLQLGTKRHPSDWKVGFAMRENVLFAALSTDGDAVRVLEERADQKAALSPVFGAEERQKGPPENAPWMSAGSALHRFWFAPFFGDRPFRAGIDKFSAESFAAFADITAPEFLTDDLHDPDCVISGVNTKAAALAADAACLLAFLPRKAAARYLNGYLYPAGNAQEYPAGKNEDAVVYLNTKPYGGSLFGVAIPALTALCPGIMISRDNIEQTLTGLKGNEKYPRLAENINEKSRVLVPVQWQKGNALFKVYDVEYGIVELNRVNHGFTFCSARKSYDMQQKSTVPQQGPWRTWLADEIKDNGRPSAFLWIDFAPLLYETRQLISITRIATSLGLLELDADDTATVNAVGGFLLQYTPSGHLAVTARPSAAAPDALRLKIEFVK